MRNHEASVRLKFSENSAQVAARDRNVGAAEIVMIRAQYDDPIIGTARGQEKRVRDEIGREKVMRHRDAGNILVKRGSDGVPDRRKKERCVRELRRYWSLRVGPRERDARRERNETHDTENG